ncbi:hypothetical protein SDJN02_09498, partial [Cucurbita argyrosperma subsp. argyrosperma]
MEFSSKAMESSSALSKCPPLSSSFARVSSSVAFSNVTSCHTTISIAFSCTNGGSDLKPKTRNAEAHK